MTFISLTTIRFIIFLIMFTVIYYVAPKKLRWIVLFIASIIFYISAGIEKLPFIVLTSLVVFLAAGQINKIYEASEREADEKKLAGRQRMDFLAPVKKKCRNNYLIPTIVFAVGILCYCKVGIRILEILH